MTSRIKSFLSVTRNTALCYICLSNTFNEDDKRNLERQRANIQIECERRGWTPEWYTDTAGHTVQSGKNRLGWLALKARLGDPDVVAIVVNDLDHLRRVGDLIGFVGEHGVQLVIASPGQMRVIIEALIAEYYAMDISRRAKDGCAYRKRQGR